MSSRAALLTVLATLVVVPSAADEASRLADLAPSPAALDFGERGHGESVPLELTLHNRGTKPLRVAELKPSCGCTTVFPTTIRQPIPAGGSTKVKVTVSSSRTMGTIDKYVGIRVDGGEDWLKVPVRMRVFAEYEVEPHSLSFAGEVDGQPVTEGFTLSRRRAGGAPPKLEIDGVFLGYGSRKERSDAFHVQVTPTDGGQRVAVRLDTSLPEGRFSGELRGKLDGKEFHFAISGEMFRGLKPSSTYFSFQRVDAADPATLEQTISLASIDGRSFTLGEPEIVFDRTPDDRVSFAVDSAADGTSRLRLVGKLSVPESLAGHGSFSGKVRFATDHPEKPTIEFRFLGFFPAPKR